MLQVFQILFPQSEIKPSGFEMIGTIGHLNLKSPFQLQNKFIIGQVFLDKNLKLKTIVNKTEALSNEYRTPVLEIIAGDPNLETE